MDYIKVLLIGLIAVIVYYLALQWSALPEQEVVFNPEAEEVITLKEEGLNDSKDLLSALDTAPPGVAEPEETKPSEMATSRLFYIKKL